MFPGGEVGPGSPGGAISAFVMGLGGKLGLGVVCWGGCGSKPKNTASVRALRTMPSNVLRTATHDAMPTTTH